MRISVITPSYNQGTFLEATIRSVLSQNYANLEYIVIDGCSSDQSVEVIKGYETSLSHWVSEKDHGQSHAFNKGLRMATGDIIGWLNSDDMYLGRSLFRAAAYFARHPATDIVFSDYWFIDGEGRFLKRRKEIPFQQGVYLWTNDCYHANCAGFFRRRVFDKVGGLDEGLHFGMDYDFYLRAAKAGMVFDHQRECWGAYRLHASSKSVSRYGQMMAEGLTIARRFRPDSISPVGARLRRWAYSAYRIARKLMTGCYIPGRPPRQEGADAQ